MKTTIYDILSVFEVNINDIRSTNRNSDICDIRKILAHELRSEGLTFQKIGKIMNKDHSAIQYNVKEYGDRLLFDKNFKKKVELVEKIKNEFMKILLTLDNSKLVVLNNSMQFLDGLIMQNHPKKNRMILSLTSELRTELLLKAIKTRQKDKHFVMKLPYHKAEALFQYLTEYEIEFPDSFGSYENNAILQMKAELHRQLL